jgi:hypothetical protein
VDAVVKLMCRNALLSKAEQRLAKGHQNGGKRRERRPNDRTRLITLGVEIPEGCA